MSPEASELVATQPLPDRARALGALAAYRGLLAALRRHGWQLLGGDDRRLAAASRVTRDARDAAAVRLLDALAAAPSMDPSATAASPLAAAWSEAARCVAAAGDLLATHRDTDGAHRSPTAWLLDHSEVRAAGLGALAHATEVVAGDATDLGLHALQAGLDPRRARMLARLPARVGPAARELRILCSHPGPAHDALADLELARPTIRTDHPIDELGDRLARLHRGAW